MFIGDLHITSGVMALIGDNIITKQDVLKCVKRFINLDYGNLDSHDIGVNDTNLNHNCGTVHGNYTINDNTIWIITTLSNNVEDVYSVVLLPEEY